VSGASDIARLNTYFKELVDQNTRFVNHCKIERAPVLEEGEIKELIVDGEKVIGVIVVDGRRGAHFWSYTYVHLIPGL
jgi:hypothetical protein